jgi:RNA polymerase sigma factor (sigma-70 family)
MNDAAERAPVGELGAVLERLRPWINRILARYRIPSQDAEDLVQTTLMLAVMKWAEIAMPGAWLLATLANRCVLYWRARQLEVARFEPLDNGQMVVTEPAQEVHALLADLDAASQQLPAAQRRLLVLRFRVGLNSCEVAKAMGLAQNSIKKSTRRALERLRLLLGVPAADEDRRATVRGSQRNGSPGPAGWTTAIDAYLAAANLWTSTTRASYRSHLIAAGAFLGDKALDELEEADLVSYRAALLKDGRTAGTHVVALRVLRCFLLWAGEQGLHSVAANGIRVVLRGWQPGSVRRLATGRRPAPQPGGSG